MAGISAQDLIKNLQQSNYSYRVSYTKRFREADENVQNLRGNLEDFRKSVRQLKKYTSGVTSAERLEKQLTSFIKSYNKISSNAGKITDRELKKQLNELEELIGSNEKQLEKIGITKNKKGRLEFDTEKFEEAETKYLDELFVGRNSFISKASKILRGVDKDVDEAEYTTVERNISYNKKYDMNDVEFVADLTNIQNYLTQFSDIVKEANSGDYKKVMEGHQSYVIYYLEEMGKNLSWNVFHNNDSDKNNRLENIRVLFEDKEILDNLKSIGLEPVFDNGSFNTFSIDYDYWNDCFKQENIKDFYDAFQSLFGEKNTFANTIIESCQKVFDDIINPKSLGVEIIDQSV